jgi:hypothetical protein
LGPAGHLDSDETVAAMDVSMFWCVSNFPLSILARPLFQQQNDDNIMQRLPRRISVYDFILLG